MVNRMVRRGEITMQSSNRRSFHPVVVLSVGLLSAALALTPMLRSDAKPRAAGTKIGAMVGVKSFRALDGKTYDLKASTPTVYLFLATECPVANLYTPRILALEKAHAPRTLRIVGVYPNTHESAAEVTRHAKERSYTFPIVKDDGTLTA